MTSFHINITANFRTPPGLASIEEQYRDLWRLAKTLQAIGMPLGEWYPPAMTPAASLLNRAFDEGGPTVAALAMAKADPENQDRKRRHLGVWNGIDEDGGAAFTSYLNPGPIPCHLDFGASDVAPLRDHRNVLTVVESVLDIWRPILVSVDTLGYFEHQVFKDRPGVGWMLYLARPITAKQVPEAAQVIPIVGDDKKQKGTIIVSVNETFDVANKEHVKRANAIEVRLVDQDLLPTNAEIVAK